MVQEATEEQDPISLPMMIALPIEETLILFGLEWMMLNYKYIK
jgi:hypothetical protein